MFKLKMMTSEYKRFSTDQDKNDKRFLIYYLQIDFLKYKFDISK